MDFGPLASGAQQLEQKKTWAAYRSPSSPLGQSSQPFGIPPPPGGGPGGSQGGGQGQLIGGSPEGNRGAPHGAGDRWSTVTGRSGVGQLDQSGDKYFQFDPIGPDLSNEVQGVGGFYDAYGGMGVDPSASGGGVGVMDGGSVPWGGNQNGAAWLDQSYNDAQHGGPIQSATARELEALNNRGIHAGNDFENPDNNQSWIDDYIDQITNAEHDWQSSVDQNAMSRDAALRAMYEQMGSRGMGASGASAFYAGDIARGAARDLAGEWEQLRQVKQQEMMGLGDLLWKDRWEQLNEAQQERMADWMFNHQKEMADFLEAIKQGRPGMIDDLFDQILGSFGQIANG